MKRRLINSLSKQVVYGLFKRAEDYNGKNADGTIVRMIFQVAFYYGLKTGELLSLKVRDAFDDNEAVRSNIRVNGRIIAISPTMKSYLDDYWTCLKEKGFPTNKTAFLFPVKKRATGKNLSLAARKRKWHRDISTIAGSPNVVEKIRQAGIREFFDHLPPSMDIEDRLKNTAEFAGCSEKWLETVLASRKEEVKKAATTQDDKKFLELCRKIDDLKNREVSEEELRKHASEIMAEAKRELLEVSWRNIEHKIKKLLPSKGAKA
jgi:hypothetical protein